MISDMLVGTLRAMRFVIALLPIAAAAPAQAQLPAWLTLPDWRQRIEIVQQAEGMGAIRLEPELSTSVSLFDLLLSTPHRADNLAISRNFYFDEDRKLRMVRLVPATLSTANCAALLAAVETALGPPDGKGDQGLLLFVIRTFSWLEVGNGRAYGWVQFESDTVSEGRRPCYLQVDPR